jgi:hypothetical protein
MPKTVLLLALAMAACNSDSNAKPQLAQRTLPDLTASLDAMRVEFNAHKSEPRFVTLLSAT